MAKIKLHHILGFFVSFLLIIAVSYYIYNIDNTDNEPDSVINTEIVIYTKVGCRFCHYTKNLLSSHNIPYQEIDLTKDIKLHEQLQLKTDHFTVPYIFINEVFIGGYQQLLELSSSKELEKLFQKTRDIHSDLR